jgi:hypothetical protein
MIKSEKKVIELAALLAKDNNILISERIGLLRNEEPFEGAIGLLTSFYDKTEDYSVRKTIEGFLNDLKDQAVCKEIISEIRQPFKQSTLRMLISSCWQSGLNYSDYSHDITEIFLSGDYATALECFTVIEESVHELNLTERNEIIKLIGEYPLQTSDEKKGLTRELISILKQE